MRVWNSNVQIRNVRIRRIPKQILEFTLLAHMQNHGFHLIQRLKRVPDVAKNLLHPVHICIIQLNVLRKMLRRNI